MIKNRKYSVVTPTCQQPEVVFSRGSAVLCENTFYYGQDRE